MRITKPLAEQVFEAYCELFAAVENGINNENFKSMTARWFRSQKTEGPMLKHGCGYRTNPFLTTQNRSKPTTKRCNVFVTSMTAPVVSIGKMNGTVCVMTAAPNATHLALQRRHTKSNQAYAAGECAALSL